VLALAPFAGKPSTAWSPTTVHDYLHAKVVVADDTSFVGSYNLSHSGERNAENVLEIRDGELADQLAAFVDAVRGRYPVAKLFDPRPAGGTRGLVARARSRRRERRRRRRPGY
jgi:phosphatidylserine/phosphatidylglycerophosphate/cardiolipin synthase-like enzyme